MLNTSSCLRYNPLNQRPSIVNKSFLPYSAFNTQYRSNEFALLQLIISVWNKTVQSIVPFPTSMDTMPLYDQLLAWETIIFQYDLNKWQRFCEQIAATPWPTMPFLVVSQTLPFQPYQPLPQENTSC